MKKEFVSVLAFKRGLLGLLLLLLALPAVQAKWSLMAVWPLDGAFQPSPRAIFSWADLGTGTYQGQLEKYLDDRIGFRPYLIRLRNQLAFSLFRMARSGEIAIGRHDVLFELRQVESYMGHDRLTEAEVRFRVRRLRTVQRDLGRRGVQMLFVMAPNKARFQPEDLPVSLRPAPGTVTNYDLYLRALQADTVALLDMVPLFAQWKKTKPYPLFPRGGTHWSGYGATLTADTLLRRLEQIGELHFPAVRTTGPPRIVRATDSLRATDNDLAKPLNLLRQVEATPLAYRQLAFSPPQPGQTRPPALFVSDSFIWGLAIFSPYLLHQFADDTRVWYYGYGIYVPDSLFHDTRVLVQTLNLRQQIESRRFIVLLLTEHNLVTHEFDFTNKVYRLYHPLTAADNVAIDQIAEKLVRNATAQNANAVWAEQTKNNDGFTRRNREKAEVIYDSQHAN